MTPIRRALLSVSDKTGLIEFGKFLHDAGVEIISTGGTAKALQNEGLPVKELLKPPAFQRCLMGA